jgi:hypothetical protein
LAQVKGKTTYRIKYAIGYPAMGPGGESGPLAPAIPAREEGTTQVGHRTYPSRHGQEDVLPVHGLSSRMTDPRTYDPFKFQDGPRLQQVVQQAAQSGQKEVFDTSMIGSLLRSASKDSIVDRYLGDLMKGLDRVCRIYFQFLWHQEAFEERYGKEDLVELEDQLRQVIEQLGDLVLELKEGEVSRPTMDQQTGPELEGAISL